MKKKKMIIFIIVPIVVIVGIICYFVFNQKDWFEQKLDEGYVPISYAKWNISNNIENFDLKRGDIIDIYISGEGISEESSKEPFLKNAIVSHNQDKTNNGISIFAPEDMHSAIKCSATLTSQGYTLEIRKSNQKEKNKIEMNQEIKKFLDGACVAVPAE